MLILIMRQYFSINSKGLMKKWKLKSFYGDEYDDMMNMMNSTLKSEELNVNTSLNHSGLLCFTWNINEIATQTKWNDNLREG